MTQELSEIISEDRFREIVTTSSSPFEALASINPELAAVAYAHRDGLIRPEVLPYLTRFRELQSDEKIAIVKAMTLRYMADSEVRKEEIVQTGKTRRTEIKGDVTKYLSDNELKSTKVREAGLTIRKGMDCDARIYEAGAVRDASIHESSEETERVRRKAEALEYVQKLNYEVSVRAIEAHLEGQKYLSDNQIKGLHIEATARLRAIKFTEQIRAETARGISRDKLEEKIKLAAIDYAKGIRAAEIERNKTLHTNNSKIAEVYIENETKLMLEGIYAQREIEILKLTIERDNLKTKAEVYKNYQETLREVIKVFENLAKGRKSATLSVESVDGPITLRYESQD